MIAETLPTPRPDGAAEVRESVALETARRLGTNSAVLLASQVFNTLVAGIMGLLLIRYLGRAQYGLFASLYAFLYVFQILSSLGIDTIVFRDVARAPQDAARTASRALGLRLVLIGFSMLASWVAAAFLAPSAAYFWWVVIISTTFLFSFYPYYLLIYDVELRQGLPKLAMAAFTLAFSGAKLALIVLHAPLSAFVVLEPLSAVATLALAWFLARRMGLGLRPTFEPLHWARLLRETWPAAVAIGFINLYYRVDQLMLLRLSGPEQVGLYGASVRVVELANVIPVTFVASAFPLLARFAVESQEHLERATQLAFRAMAWAGFPLAAWLFLYAETVIRILFDAEFAPAAGLLRLLAISLPAGFVGSVLFNRLLSTSQQMSAAMLAASVAAVNVSLNVIWIPRWQAEGAALATAVSYCAVPILALALPAARGLGWQAISSMLRPALGIAAAAFLVHVLGVGALAGFFVLAVSYGGAMLLLREWTSTEARVLRHACGRTP